VSEEALTPPVRLQKDHETSDFESGAEELDTWLRQYALVNDASGNARVFVASRGVRVVGYYAIASAGVEKATAPDAIIKGGVPEQVPCILLARLAVDRAEQGGGVGKALLVDAIRRSVAVSESVGFRALLIHARDEEARAFSLHLGEFQQSPTDPLHLFLHIKQAKRLVRPDGGAPEA